MRILVLTFAALAVTSVSYAQSNVAGYIYGQVDASDKSGLTVAVTSRDTGVSRDVSVAADGSYRVPMLPVGQYTVTLHKGDQTLQTVENVNVSIGVGSTVKLTANQSTDGVVELEAFKVTGASVSPIDVSQTEAVTIMRADKIKALPVARNITAVALLAPGTTQGDNAFGNLASFGGASVAENAYFINGFNVTNFRNGLGYSTVPFEFYEEFQVKTGGYGAEFGRSLGGVVNATTKSGSNTFHAGASVYYEPDSLSTDAPSVVVDGDYTLNNTQDYSERVTTNLYVSGPIIENKLFYYALYSYADNTDKQATAASTYLVDDSNPSFWGGKLDWYPLPDHHVELTAFSDARDIDRSISTYNPDLELVGSKEADLLYRRGGKNYIGRYSGQITDDLTISALYAVGKAKDDVSAASDDRPYVYDRRIPTSPLYLGNYLSLFEFYEDERNAMRADLEYIWGNHKIRGGIDYEKNTTAYDVAAPGSTGQRYTVYTSGSGAEIVYRDTYINRGNVEVDTLGYYIEDAIKLMDDKLLVSIGLRNESFENKNKAGQSFAKLDNQLAPRLAASYDLSGDGRSRVYANYGYYYLPIASNTNLRAAGDELYLRQYYRFNGFDGNNIPQLGAHLQDSYFSAGELKNPRSVTNADLDPMYQEELIVGYQLAMGKKWSAGIRGIYRNLKEGIEDVAIDAALNKYAESKGYDTQYGFAASGFDYYVITNPGKDLTVDIDFSNDPYTPGDDDPSSTYETVTLSAADLGYPKMEREYYAIELLLERVWDGKWSVQASYTWSQSYGNTEGYVKSDNGQDDAGLTTSFDQPGLVDYSYGFLPNDRRHKIKVFSEFALTDELRTGINFLAQSGRPINAIGNHPTDAFAAEYGSESFYILGQPSPRGSQGTTPWTYTVDLSLRYRPEWAKQKITFGFDVFNLLNSKKQTEVYELYEEDYDPGYKLPQYGTATAFQTPRYVRVSVSYDF